MVSIVPRYTWQASPCPECGQVALEYDGSVKWRSGERPERKLATKDPLGFSPRADYEIAHYFHCTQCGAQLYDPIDGSYPSIRVDA